MGLWLEWFQSSVWRFCGDGLETKVMQSGEKVDNHESLCPGRRASTGETQRRVTEGRGWWGPGPGWAEGNLQDDSANCGAGDGAAVTAVTGV